MAQYVVPESFARREGFISPDQIAQEHKFTYLGKLFNNKDIHIGMIFDKQIGINAKFQFEFDDKNVSFTEEGQSEVIWVSPLDTFQLMALDPVSKVYEYKKLSEFQTIQDKIQAILNCLGNAFDINTTASTTYTEPTSYAIADDFKMFTPGEPRIPITHPGLKKLRELKADYNGNLNGTKSVICKLEDKVIQVFTGTARVYVDMTHELNSLKDRILNLKTRGYRDQEVEDLIKGMEKTDGLMAITSRKNDGLYPGGILIKLSIPGGSNETIVKETFKALYGNNIEYPGINGSGEDAGLSGGGDTLPTYDGVEEPLI